MSLEQMKPSALIVTASCMKEARKQIKDKSKRLLSVDLSGVKLSFLQRHLIS